ncbi:hypothetical protein B0H14DRAFT_3431102 [Mycena olivaceomarginata]|nr:hypothetical protein B0H14DRAFT_3431102 [Mycena olivaceomarginata]
MAGGTFWTTTAPDPSVAAMSTGSGKNGDSILVRALTAAYVRNVTTPDIRKTLRDYISVQFNAVIDLATNGDNIYGAQWIGPASSAFSENSQTSALSPLLNTAYFIASDMNITASSTSTSSTSQEQSPTPSSTPSKAPARQRSQEP